jgi:hypothetical protein
MVHHERCTITQVGGGFNLLPDRDDVRYIVFAFLNRPFDYDMMKVVILPGYIYR